MELTKLTDEQQSFIELCMDSPEKSSTHTRSTPSPKMSTGPGPWMTCGMMAAQEEQLQQRPWHTSPNALYEEKYAPYFLNSPPTARSAPRLNGGHGAHWSVPIFLGNEANIHPENNGQGTLQSCPLPIVTQKSEEHVGTVQVSFEVPIGASFTFRGETYVVGDAKKQIRTRIRCWEVTPKLSPLLAIYAKELPWSHHDSCGARAS